MIVNPCDPELLYAVIQVCFMFTTLMLFYDLLGQVFYVPYPQNTCDATGDATQLLGYKDMDCHGGQLHATDRAAPGVSPTLNLAQSDYSE